MKSQQHIIDHVSNFDIKLMRGYAKLIRRCQFLFPYHFSVEGKKTVDYTYVTICRKEDFDMVRASLYTLYKNASLLPNRIVIVSDGSWQPCVGIKYFKKYKLPIECVLWNMCADYYKDKCPSLTIWAHKHIWGKKFAVILYLSESSKVLFSDPDVLWFGTPLSEDEFYNTIFKVSVDNSHNYDSACINALGIEYLYNTEEPVNCGVVYIQGGLSLLDADALRCIDYEAENAGPFAEQTVFALIDRKFNNRWTIQEITSEISDVKHFFSLKPIITHKTLIARHYLWMLKWIYWRRMVKELAG